MMGEMEKEGMEINAKDMKEVKMLHDKLMMLADKYEMSMEDLIEKCCGDMEEEDMEEGEDMEEKKPVMDRAKIALIIGKMKPKGE